MENEIKVSIVVPIYNAEKFLTTTVDSIIAQTYKNIEIILVNDGSTDGSLALCQTFLEKDKRIKVVDKQNGGVSSARNCGIHTASGEFIMFVDSDDLIEKDACEKLVKNAIATKSDIVFCNYYVKVVEKNKEKVVFKNHNYGNSEMSDKTEILSLAQKYCFVHEKTPFY